MTSPIVPGVHHITIATAQPDSVVRVLRDAVGMEVAARDEVRQSAVAELYGWERLEQRLRVVFLGSKSTGFVEVVDTAALGPAVKSGPAPGRASFTSIALFVRDVARVLDAAGAVPGASTTPIVPVHVGDQVAQVAIVDIGEARLQLVELPAPASAGDHRS